jgi:DNA-binding SARP family transcriptional activator
MLQLSLLGSPCATLDGIPLHGTLLHKDLALLYYLAVSGRPQPRASLAALLWGDISEESARRNLRKSLTDLHRRLGDHLVITRDEIALEPAQCTLDVRILEQFAENGSAAADTAQLQAAAALYRGDFLAGFRLHNAPDYERWIYNMQERLRGTAVIVLTTLAAKLAHAGESAGAIAAQRRVLELEPWREESHRDLMLLLARSGQRSAALAQYKICVKVLAAELGVQPDAATTALAARICGSDLACDGGAGSLLWAAPKDLQQ